MLNEVDKNEKKNSTLWMKIILVGLGSVFILVGIIRQWPIAGKSYMEFIEGDGYLSLMLGLIMILLGASVRLLIGQEKE
jgi:formate hydrogenlyase subunit 3/multisubunit Na+/H+ antiporter MnhD subunit